MLEKYSETNLVKSDWTQLFPYGKSFRILFDGDAGELRLLCKYTYDLNEIVDAFSSNNPNAFFMKKHGLNVPAKLYVVNNFGFFPPGMFYEVIRKIKLKYGSLAPLAIGKKTMQYIKDYLTPLKDFIANGGLGEGGEEAFVPDNIANDTGKDIDLREYQSQIIGRLLFRGYGRGLFECPTGSGKSFIIANYIYTLMKRYDSNLKTLIFVPNVQLVEQFYQDLLSYGYKPETITRICGNVKTMKEFNKDANVFIANRQYVSRHKDLLPPVLDLIICDEAHTLGPDNASAEFIRNLCPKMIIGCSGTLPRDVYGKFSLIGLIGTIFYKEEVTKLQNEGFLSRLHITSFQITDTEVQENKDYLFHPNTNVHYDDESEDGIAYNDAYIAEKEYLVSNCQKLFTPVLRKTRDETKGNVLLLFERLEFGKVLFERAKTVFAERGADVVLRYVDGQTPVEEREKIRQECENAKDKRVILFGQVACLSTGINIKNLETLVMLSSSKAIARTIQSIGRTLRLFSTKERANIIDVNFNFKYSHKHYLHRLELYREFYHKKGPDEIIRAKV